MGLVPYKERTESVLSLQSMLGCGEELTLCKSGRKATPGTVAANLILDFQAPGETKQTNKTNTTTTNNKISCCFKFPVYGILF